MSYPALTPAILLALWSLIVTFLMFFNRLGALRSKKIKYSYFRVLQGVEGEVPENLIQYSRHYSNLFEMPVLFYSVIGFSMILGLASDLWIVGAAWGYLFLRMLHSTIHLSYNNITHRLVPFALSVVVLLGMWLRILAFQLNF